MSTKKTRGSRLPKDPHSLNEDEQARTITPVIMCFTLLLVFCACSTNKLGTERTSVAFLVYREALLTPPSMITEAVGSHHLVTVGAKGFGLAKSIRHFLESFKGEEIR
jgi:hypothetical protein